MRQRLSAFLDGMGTEGLAAWLVRAAAGNGLVKFIGIVASFTMGVQLARGLGPTNYGYYSIALSVIALAGIPSEFGLPTLLTREVAAASVRNDRNELFAIVRWAERSCRKIALTIMAGVVAGALLLKGFYSRELLGCLLLGAPIIPLLSLSRVRCGAMLGLNRVVQSQIPEIIIRPVFFSLVLAGLYLLHKSLSPQLAMALFSMTTAVVLVFSSIWLRQTLPGRPTEPIQVRERSFASAIPMGLMDGIRIIQGELSIFLAAFVAAPAIVGLLRIANVTAIIAATPLSVMVQVGAPLMARLHASNDDARLQKTVTALAQAQFAGVLLVSLPLILFPGPLLSFAFGPTFAPASGALRVLLIGQIANAAFGLNNWLLNMTRHERRVVRALSIALAINAIAVPLLASRWGATGGALALFISMICWNLISWRDARRLLGIETSIFRWPWVLRLRSA